jgi:transcriptional regulator with XRE-family HTH domain
MKQESLGRKLQLLRAERGLTLVQASALTGVTRGTLSELESGKRVAYMPTLSKIAEGYGVDVRELLLEEPVPLGEALGEAGQAVKGPDPAVWGPEETRPKPPMPESAGERIHVQIEGGQVSVTKRSFLDIARELREGRITPEDAWERISA